MNLRRNDYIASIRHDLEETRQALDEFPRLLSDGEELLQYCKLNKLRGFKKVARLEIKLLKEKNKFNKRRFNELRKLLYKAEKYTPGRNE